MDSFDLNFLNKGILNHKNLIKSRFDTFNFTNKEIKNNLDSLCFVWDYSPKMTEEKKSNEVFKIKPEHFVFNDMEKSKEKEKVKDEGKSNEKKKKNEKVLNEANVKKDDKEKDKDKENEVNSFCHTGSLTKRYSKFKKLTNKSHNELIIKQNKSGTMDIQGITQQSNNDTENNENIENKDNDDEKKEKDEEENEDDDEDEEKYFEMIRKTRNARSINKNDKKINSLNENMLINNLSKRHRLTENTMMRVYLFETQDYLDFQVFFGETIKDLKIKILKIIFELDKEDLNKLNYHIDKSKLISISNNLQRGQDYQAYDIRIADEDEDVFPNFDFPPLDNKLNLLSSKWHTLCILENKDFNNKIKNLTLGFIKDSNKVVLKIFNKTSQYIGNSSHTVIEEDAENDLRTVIERLEKKKFFIVSKKFNFYSIYEHSEEEIDENEQNDDKEINPILQLKYLNCFEIDVYLKKYSDAPEFSSLPLNSLNARLGKVSILSKSTYMRPAQNNQNQTNFQVIAESDSEVRNEGKDFVFNDITASQYQEFEVVKINKYNVKQERLLGIDRYYLYNNFPNVKEKKILGLFQNSNTKNPLRSLKDIVKVDILSNKMFYIDINENGEVKRMVFEVKSVNIRNEIVAKIKYIKQMDTGK